MAEDDRRSGVGLRGPNERWASRALSEGSSSLAAHDRWSSRSVSEESDAAARRLERTQHACAPCNKSKAKVLSIGITMINLDLTHHPTSAAPSNFSARSQMMAARVAVVAVWAFRANILNRAPKSDRRKEMSAMQTPLHA